MGAEEYGDESSGDRGRLVTAEVGMDGLPTMLVISSEAMKLPSRELAERIITAIRAAHGTTVQRLLQRFDQVATGLTDPPLQAVNTAFEDAREQAIRASRAATERADDVRRTLREILDQ
jgi:hypothetical protein